MKSGNKYSNITNAPCVNLNYFLMTYLMWKRKKFEPSKDTFDGFKSFIIFILILSTES